MRKYLVLLSALALMAINLNCTRIGVGQAGIKVSMAGSDRGAQDIPVRTGWVFYMPGFSTVVEYPTVVQTAVWTRSAHEGKAENEEISFNSKDGLIFYADVNLSYLLKMEKVPQFYTKYRADDITTFTHGLMRQVARDEFSNVAVQYTAEEIYGVKKEEFCQTVRGRLNKQFESVGLVVESLGFIGAPRPPQQFTDAINSKLSAIQKAQQAQNELAQAQAEAQKSKARGEGQAAAILAEARGQAEANRILSSSLTPELVRYKTVEKWSGHLPTYMGGSGPLPFLSVEKK